MFLFGHQVHDLTSKAKTSKRQHIETMKDQNVNTLKEIVKLVNLKSNFVVLCTNVKVYLYNYS